MKKTFLLVGASLILILSGCQNSATNSNANTSKTNTNSESTLNLANPASSNCLAKGGKLEIRENKKGQYGVCLFDGNRQCEEWAFLRGQCPEGGLDVKGFDNEAKIYCAITGGQFLVSETGDSLCKRIDGTLCTVQANFDGECPDPNDPNPSAGNVEAK